MECTAKCNAVESNQVILLSCMLRFHTHITGSYTIETSVWGQITYFSHQILIIFHPYIVHKSRKSCRQTWWLTCSHGLQIENISTSALQVISKPVIPAVAILPDTASTLAVFQTRWACEICQVTVSSELTLQSHLRGRKHRAEAMLWCTFCNLRVSGEIDMIAHLKGKRHLAKLQETLTNSGAS